MNCPACGAPIALKPDTDGFKCDYCHAVFFPGAEEDGVTVVADSAVDPAGAAPSTSAGVRENQACPACSLPLVHALVAQHALLYCPQCRGLLMPMNVLPGLIDAKRKESRSAGHAKPAVQTPPDHQDLRRVLQCPGCSRKMDTHFYAGPGNVILDSCAVCFLIWLDRGELSRIANAPDEGDSTDSAW